jgi:hypothetical protein
MPTLLLHASLVASLLASLASFQPAVAGSEACAPTSADVSSWPIVRSPRVPGLTLRLPRSFERESDPAAASPLAATSATAARWTHAASGQLVISRGAPPAGVRSAPSADGASYKRCEERVGSAVAVIESYDRGASGESAFHVQARFRWPDGEEVVVLGDAADRERFSELLAAVRTIRRTAA